MLNSLDTKLKPWQLDMIKKFKGKGTLQVTGRGSGKSQLAAYARLWSDIYAKPIEALICDTGTVYGKRYYTVEPVGGAWFEMEDWCHKTFGESSTSAIWGEAKTPEPAERWYTNARKFWFRDVKDRDWFVIRWNA